MVADEEDNPRERSSRPYPLKPMARIPNALARSTKELADRVDERLFGVREPLRLVMVGVLTGNHVLIDDVPGVGKTTLVRILSNLLGLRFQRVQFTPDLMPSDVTGTSILDLRTRLRVPRARSSRRSCSPTRSTARPRDAGGAARGDAGTTGHGRRRHAPAAEPVLRARDAEPDRARGNVPAARGAARPVPAPRQARLPEPSARRNASSRRAPAQTHAAERAAPRPAAAARAPRRRRVDRARAPGAVLRDRARTRDARPPGARGRGEPARGRADGRRGASVRDARRPGLRVARRREGARRAGVRPPHRPDHRRADPRPRAPTRSCARSCAPSRSRPS